MQRFFSSSLVLAGALASGTAWATPDACDEGGGYLTGDVRYSVPGEFDGLIDGAHAGDNLGYAMALGDFNGDLFLDIAVSGHEDDTNGGGAGAVYVWYGGAGSSVAEVMGDATTADVTMLGESIADKAGWDVVNLGDLDLDGTDDLGIGTKPKAGRSLGAGMMYVLYGDVLAGGATDVDLYLDSRVRIYGGSVGDEFGSHIASAGDFDFDGVPDFVVGAPNALIAGERRGAVYMFSGASVAGELYANLDEEFRITGATVGSKLGVAIGGIGDIDSDGYADFAAGAPRDNTGGKDAGAAYIVLGRPMNDLPDSFPASSADWRLYGSSFDRCGTSMSTAGSLDADAYPEFWIGCREYGSFKVGAAFMIRGGFDPKIGNIRTQSSFELYGKGANMTLGTKIVGNVDINGDGIGDIVTSGERGDGEVVGSGAAWVVYGPFPYGTAAESRDYSARLRGRTFEEFFGHSLEVSDVDADGFADIFVGAFRSNNAANRAGVVAAWRGGRDELDLTTFYFDSDDDLYGDPSVTIEDCAAPPNYVANDDDCNDGSALWYPGAAEPCPGDGNDYNCDGFTGTSDADLDGYDACEECDDGNPNVNPGKTEICNDIDDDCDGVVDGSGAADAVSWYPDGDNDGFGSDDPLVTVVSCSPPPGAGSTLIGVTGDCDDTNASINPAAAELCDAGGVDENCDGFTNDDSAVDAVTYFRDDDGDGYGDPKQRQLACSQPTGYASNRDDCNDSNSSVNPLGTEICDYEDNDCSGQFYLGGPVYAADAFASFTGPEDGSQLTAAGYLRDQDFDGDDELVLRAPRADAGGLDAGAVYIRFGEQAGGVFDMATVRSDGSTFYDIRILGNRKEMLLGADVDFGDFDGDLITDMVISAPGARVPSANQGALYVFYGPLDTKAELTVDDASLRIKGTGDDIMGVSTTMLDFDGDGYKDIVVGEPLSQTSLPAQGKVWVVYGGSRITGDRTIGSIANAWMDGPVGNLNLGVVVENMGDLDNDGTDDLGLGVPDRGILDAGGMYLVYGSSVKKSGAITTYVDFTAPGDGNYLGTDIDGVGDVDNDGVDDFLVGTRVNRAYLVLGQDGVQFTSGPIAPLAQLKFEGPLSSKAGRNVEGLGDLNDDGYADFAISAPDSDVNGLRDSGAIYFVYGKSVADFETLVPGGGTFILSDLESFGRLEGGVTFPVYSAVSFDVLEGGWISGENAFDEMGSVVGMGDYDGDAIPDVIVSSAKFDRSPLQQDSGKAYLYLGSSYGTDVFAVDTIDYYWDWDADGFTADPISTFEACEMHVPINFDNPGSPKVRAYSTPQVNGVGNGDCDDFDASVNPDAVEVSEDGTDSDCDGFDSPNILPIISVEIDPNLPEATDTLVADVTTIDNDPEVTAITYEYYWEVNDSVVPGQTASTLLPLYFSKGDKVAVFVRANDTRGLTDWVTDEVTIANSKPYMDACVVTPGTANITTDFNVEAQGVSDDDAGDLASLSVRFRWQKYISPSWFDVPGSEDNPPALTFDSARDSCFDTFDPTPGYQYNCYRGQQIRAVCKPTDPNWTLGAPGYADYFSDPITISNSRPTMDSCSISPLSATTNTILSASGSGSDVDLVPTGAEPVTVNFEWIVNNVPTGITTTNLDGATAFDHFDVVRVRCTPVDQYGDSGDFLDSDPLVIGNTPPGAPVIDLLPDSPRSDQDLLVQIDTPATDVDGDALTYWAAWQRDGSPVNNPDPVTTNLNADDALTAKGETWSVTVYASDGTDIGPSVMDSVVIRNTPPTITGVAILPTTPRSDDNITASAVGYSDYDGDADATEFSWYVNSVLTATGPGLATVFTSKGDVVRVDARAYDSENYGNTATSGDFTIGNTPPYAVTLAGMTPSPASEDDPITCNVATAATDYDGDTVSYEVVFIALRTSDPFAVPPPTPVPVILQSNAGTRTTSTVGVDWTVPSALTQYGDQVYCSVTTYDDSGAMGPTSDADPVQIQDLSLPAAPVVAAIERYRNDDEVTLSGTCIDTALECDNLFIQCLDDLGNYLVGTGQPLEGVAGTCATPTANPADGVFSEDITLTRGRDWQCWGFCTDLNGNRSANSNTRSTEICDPYDVYELRGDAVGDTQGAAVTDWSALNEGYTTSYDIEGNIIGDGTEFTDSEDWFRIDATNNAGAADTLNFNAFNYEVSLTEGAASYNITVFRTPTHGLGAAHPQNPSLAPSGQLCVGTLPNGYDDFNMYQRDNLDYSYVRKTSPANQADNYYPRVQPQQNAVSPTWSYVDPGTTRQACGSEAAFNECNNFTSAFWIRVTRTTGEDCTNYAFTVTNGDPTAVGL